MERHSVSCGDAALEVFEHRNAARPPLIFLHGGPGLPGYMGALAPELERDFWIFDYYQRSLPAAPGRKGPGVEAHVEDLSALVDWVGAKTFARPVLLGHSWGATLASLAAARIAGRVEKLILVGPAPLTKTTYAVFSSNVLSRLSARDSAEAERLRSRLADPVASREERASLYLSYCALILPVYTRCGKAEIALAGAELETDADLERLLETGLLHRRIKAIPQRTLILHGDYDPIPADLVKQEYASVAPRLEHVLLEDCGHLPWLESTRVQEAFFGRIRRFGGNPGMARNA